MKSEANWSVWRRDFAPGFEDVFEHGVRRGWYDPNKVLEKYDNTIPYIVISFFNSLLFRWIAIPWIQDELDKWVLLRNRTAPRANKHKVLPHGIPAIIRQKPEQFNVLDFKVWRTTDLI